MRSTALLPLLPLLAVIMLFGVHASAQTPPTSASTPVLVELFTSEGCSSCPPADALLERLDRRQPVPDARLIVLSEHVDYWNYIGWKDPYSSPLYSERQGRYAGRLRLRSAYTPQMVVDGALQFVGSDAEAAEQAVREALRLPKIPVRITSLSSTPSAVRAHVEAGPLPKASGGKAADVYVALALNRAESSVSRGENAGRSLAHTAVVITLKKAGTIAKAGKFSADVELKIERETDPQNLRLIAFVQEADQGRVLGAAMEMAMEMGRAGE